MSFKALICDIEGTLCPIDFVHKVLFPYALQHARGFLESSWSSPSTQKLVQDLFAQSEADKASGMEGLVPVVPDSVDSVVANVAWQMSFDRKAGPLKNLQGSVWRAGYESGVIVSDVYTDVLPALRSNLASGRRNYIYSSGSVGAQKLLFSFTPEGNVLDLFAGYFDTAIGFKREKQSYTNIIQAIGVAPEECLFLTDIYEESVAASAAGMKTVLMLRTGNAPLPADNPFPTASTVDEAVSLLDQ